MLFADVQGPRTALIVWNFDEPGRPSVIQPPLLGARARVVGATLVDRGLVALVDNGATLRAYATHVLHASTDANPLAGWDGGALLAVRVLAPPPPAWLESRSLQCAP